jgi:hypothetical protein
MAESAISLILRGMEAGGRPGPEWHPACHSQGNEIPFNQQESDISDYLGARLRASTIAGKSGERSMNGKNTKVVLLAAAVLFFVPPAAAAQGRPGGRPGQKPSAGQMQKRQPGQTGKTDKTRVRATDRQRDQLRTCTQSTDRLRTQARDMDRMAKGGAFNAQEARRLRDRMREQLRTIEREHQRLMNGMNDQQNAALRNRIEQMNQIRQRVNSRLGRMDAELDKGQPDPKIVREQARQIEREMNRWNSQYRSMEGQMGVTP